MAFPEFFKVGPHFRLSKLKEFEFDEDYPPEGGLIMWEPPRRGYKYVVGVDPSWGVGGDRAAIHVNRVGTVHEKDTQVAEFCSDSMNVHDLTPVCYMIGNLYKDEVEDQEAMMAVEVNISDDIMHRLRMDYNYGNLYIRKKFDNLTKAWTTSLGWKTDLRNRPSIIQKGIHYVKHGYWDINSPWLLNELSTIEKVDDEDLVRAKVEAAPGAHDDLAMAAFIALFVSHELDMNEISGSVEEVAKQRARRMTAYAEAFAAPQQPPLSKRKDFINTACSAEDAQSFMSLDSLNRYYEHFED
jgi:hypothetical protein